jgi:hypothetical protein
MHVPRCARNCRLSLIGLLLITWHIGAAAARADCKLDVPSAPPSNAELARARDSFHSGLADAEAARWPMAVLAFEEAYRRSGNPVALLNLASALRESGRVADARACIIALRARHAPQLDGETEAAAREVYASVTAVVTLRGAPPNGVVLVDGVTQADATQPFELDPGLHRVEVRAPGRAPFQWQDVVSATQRLELAYRASTVVEPPPAAPGADHLATGPGGRVDANPHQAGRSRRLYKNPWLWAGVGAVLAGTAVALALTQPWRLEPDGGSTGDVYRGP